MAIENPKRLYEVWKGSNKFCCGGRLIFGPDGASLFLTIFLIAGPSILFCSQVIAKIHNHNKQPSDHQEGTTEQNQILGFPVLVVTILITAADLFFLLLTSSRDPGIVPRNSQPPESDDQVIGLITPSTEWVNARAPYLLRLPRTKDVVVNGFIVKVKYCDTCLLYRPPRTSHCSVCNNCIQKFDHHCPWVGQCIGLRNYRFFFLFISSSTFLCMYVFTFSWLNIIGAKKYHSNSIWKSMTSEVVSLVLIIYTFITVWFVGGLTVLHLYLLIRNQTTYENFRYCYDKKDNPYNKGLLRNLKDVFLSRIPPSMNDFRSWVPEDTSEAGSGSTTPMDFAGSKEKNESERVGKPELENILRNFDHTTIGDNLEEKSSHRDSGSDPCSFPGIQEPINQRPRGGQSSMNSDDMVVDERIFGSNRASSVSYHGVHVLRT